jgi:mannose-6-phosphate isomerase-like protein (cupin superfamily)
MKGFEDNIEKLTLENNNFRKIIYTAKFSQLVVMSLEPKEEIGEEIHDGDQFFRFEKGTGVAVLEGKSQKVSDGDTVIVPAGTKHNIINTSDTEPLKLYTIYSPPHHRDGVVHATKQEAESDQEHFDGKTSE